MSGIFPVEGTDKSFYVVIDRLDQGWSTRTFPHLLSDRQLYVADNVVFNRDGLVSKRPGNIAYGSGSGAVGTGTPSLAGTRFYPVGSAPQLLVHSGTQIYKGNDVTGAFTSVGAGLSASSYANFAQVYDPDMSTGAATAMVVCDGVHIPQLYDGVNFTPVQTAAIGGSLTLPKGRGGAPITPHYVTTWREHLVYAGEPTEPTAVYISDALRPERFNGYGLLDSGGTPYTAYFPAGRDGKEGAVTGLAQVGPYLIVFYTSAVIVGVNTGTYGTYQYQWSVISTATGCTSPRSIQGFEGYVIFFGGDRFYATDGQAVLPIPDEIPSVYGNTSQSAFPSELRGKGTVAGVRRSGQYWAAYDNTGGGQNASIVVFDTQANGGYTFGSPQGGAWSRWPTGMPLAWGVECRGPGDVTAPFYWGLSTADTIAQHDTGVYGDFGLPTALEIRAKAFFLDKPIWPKDVQALYVVGAFPAPLSVTSPIYTDAITGYVVLDLATSIAPTVTIGQPGAGVPYGGGAVYGDGTRYGNGSQIVTSFAKTYPQQDAKGTVVQPGVLESSTNPFNLLAFTIEVIVDEPSP